MFKWRKVVVAFVSASAATLLTGCNARGPTQSQESARVAYGTQAPPSRPAPTVVDERSDCAPGAPPASLANAVDVLHAHCDRARAVAIVASVGALAFGARFGGAAGGAAAEEMGAAEIATTARTLVTGARIGGSVGQAMNDDRDRDFDTTGAAAYDQAQYAGGTTANDDRHASPSQEGDRPGPVTVTDLGDGNYDVTMSDGKKYRMTAEQLDAAYRAW